MLKKTITYKDFDGNERTEEHYFNLTQTELAEIAIGLPDGISEIDVTESNEQAGQKLLDKLGGDGVFKFLKDLMLKSYGIRVDSRRFEKSDQISREFSQTLAFDAMFMELMTDDVAAAKFVNAVIPAEAANKLIGTNTPSAN